MPPTTNDETSFGDSELESSTQDGLRYASSDERSDDSETVVVDGADVGVGVVEGVPRGSIGVAV